MRIEDKQKVIRQELIRCKQDPVYFTTRYCKIANQDSGIIPFKMYEFQKRVMNNLREHDRNIILKSRQLGISTLTSAYALWLMLFHKSKKCLALATNQDTAKNIIDKVKLAYDNLPSFMRVPTTEYNKLSISFVNGSKIKAVAATKSAGRSESLSLLIIDEAAFIEPDDKIREIWTSTQPTLASNASCIILSTPNGHNNFFHEMWTNSENGKNNFNFVRLPWTVHPEHDQSWRDKQDVELGEKKAAQECDCVHYDTQIRLYDNELEMEYNASIGSIYDDLSSRKLIKPNNGNYKILTENGFEDFHGIRKVKKDNYFSIKFTDRTQLKCSSDHKLITLDDEEITPSKLLIDTKIKSIDGYKIVKRIEKYNSEIELYDVVESGKDNKYYTDTVLSHNCSFLTSGDTFVSTKILSRYMEYTDNVKPLDQRYNGELLIWDYALSNYEYIVSADVSRGDSTDYSTFQVLRVDNLEQVAEYKGKIDTEKFGTLLCNIAREYNKALLVPENNGVGWSTIQSILNDGYDNLYYSVKDLKYNDPNEIARHNRYSLGDKSNLTPGVYMNNTLRDLILDKMERLMRHTDVNGDVTSYPLIKSSRLISELLSFVNVNGKVSAQYGKNDDLIMAYALGVYMKDMAYSINEQDLEINKSLLMNSGRSRPIYTNKPNIQNPYTMQYGSETIDYSFLSKGR